MISYFAKVEQDLRGDSAHAVLEEILICEAQWNLFANVPCRTEREFENVFYPLLHVLTVVLRMASRHLATLLPDFASSFLKV